MLPPSIRRISLSYEEKYVVLCFPLFKIFLMLELLIVVHVRHTETNSEAENLKDFIHLSGVAAIITTAATLLMSSFFTWRECKSAELSLLGWGIRTLHYKELKEWPSLGSGKARLGSELVHGLKSRYHWRVNGWNVSWNWHDVKLERIRELRRRKNLDMAVGSNMSPITGDLEGRKKILLSSWPTTSLHTPGGPLGIYHVSQICGDILELEEEFSQVWSEAWAPSDIGSNLQWVSRLRVEEINACIFGRFLSLISSTVFKKARNGVWLDGKKCSRFQIIIGELRKPWIFIS